MQLKKILRFWHPSSGILGGLILGAVISIVAFGLPMLYVDLNMDDNMQAKLLNPSNNRSAFVAGASWVWFDGLDLSEYHSQELLMFEDSEGKHAIAVPTGAIGIEEMTITITDGPMAGFDQVVAPGPGAIYVHWIEIENGFDYNDIASFR